jgi:hypothetical protein
MTDTQFFWYMVVNALVAVGTIGAVLVALFGSPLRAKFFAPVFKFNVLKLTGEACPLKNPQQQHVADGRYYHLNVRNTRGWVPATHSQLRLIRIENPGPDGQPQVVWDGDIPMRRRQQEHYPTESVIGSPVHFDLCAIIKSDNDPTPKLQLMPIVIAYNLPMPWTGETHFTASFQLKCAERDSQVVRIHFNWDGIWHDGDAEVLKSFILKEDPA